ncbi:MAG: sigma-54 dependent transcriptional regulator, partial [Pseudomonadota bacterium]
NVETAVEATRHGAYDFIEKPLSIAKLLLTIKHALEASSLKQENMNLLHSTLNRLEPIGKSKLMDNLRAQLNRISKHEAPVLIYGSSGTDKELYARYIHSISHRAAGPFIIVSVTALSNEHANRELFGEIINNELQEGYLESAKGGSLFIKDIAELDSGLQSQLHNTIESKMFSHIGTNDAIPLDCRIIAATRHNLEKSVNDGQFRDDLFYQLNVLPVSIPSLNEHFEDIPAILEYYVNYFIETEGLPYRRFSVAAQNRLRSYKWPGNVRELKNLVQRFLILGNEEIIDVEEVESSLGYLYEKRSSEIYNNFDFDMPLKEARDKFEKSYLEYQLEKADGSVSKVATAVGVERTHLYRKLKSLGIDLK